MSKTVYIVHCIDTEGHLTEDLKSTFDRIYDSFKIKIKPSINNLHSLQDKKLNLDGLEDDVSKFLSTDLLKYNNNWSSIDSMLDELLSNKFRNEVLDSFDNGWIYNWHCMDHVGFKNNPRKRDLGHHKIFDHYKNKLKYTNSYKDGLHFHHHPIPFFKDAHLPATHFFSHTPAIFEIISRKIIERQWFPSVYRPGFHSTRPDSHWFLEQFIPFDIANQSTDENYSKFKDLGDGRFGDWRRAPNTWEPYNPHHDDYQIKGQCRRWIFRSLNIGTRARLLKRKHVFQAFKEASENKPVILSFNHHDFRDMRLDIIKVRNLIKDVSSNFIKVKYMYCEARDGIRRALGLRKKKHINFKVTFDDNKMYVNTSMPTFGPQPFLAIKLKNGKFFHDNFDFKKPFYSWSYTFDNITIPIEKIEKIGFASSDNTGNSTVVNINSLNLQPREYYL